MCLFCRRYWLLVKTDAANRKLMMRDFGLHSTDNRRRTSAGDEEAEVARVAAALQAWLDKAASCPNPLSFYGSTNSGITMSAK